MGVMSGDGVMLKTVTTDSSVLWKYGVGQDDINAANLYLQNTYDFDNNDTPFAATNQLRAFYNATENYDPTTAKQNSFQNLFSDFKPFVGSNTSTTGTNNLENATETAANDPIAINSSDKQIELRKETVADPPKAIVPVPTTTYTPTSAQVTPQTMATNVVTPATPATTGTTGTPLQTAGLSSVPSTTQVNPNVTGTTMANLTSQSQRGFGGVVKYRNSETGLEIMISVDAQGKPLTIVPPGYTKVQGQAEGGSVAEDSPDVCFGLSSHFKTLP